VISRVEKRRKGERKREDKYYWEINRRGFCRLLPFGRPSPHRGKKKGKKKKGEMEKRGQGDGRTPSDNTSPFPICSPAVELEGGTEGRKGSQTVNVGSGKGKGEIRHRCSLPSFMPLNREEGGRKKKKKKE